MRWRSAVRDSPLAVIGGNAMLWRSLHAFLGELPAGVLALLQMRKLHAAKDARRLAELHIAILDHFNPVSPGIEEIEELAVQQGGSGGARQFADFRSIVDDKAEVPLLVRVPGLVFRQCDELITQFDEGLPCATSPQFEREYPAIELQRGFDVADFKRDVIKPNQPGSARLGHVPLNGARSQADVLSSWTVRRCGEPAPGGRAHPWSDRCRSAHGFVPPFFRARCGG